MTVLCGFAAPGRRSHSLVKSEWERRSLQKPWGRASVKVAGPPPQGRRRTRYRNLDDSRRKSNFHCYKLTILTKVNVRLKSTKLLFIAEALKPDLGIVLLPLCNGNLHESTAKSKVLYKVLLMKTI